MAITDIQQGLSTNPQTTAFDTITGGRNFTLSSNNPANVVDVKVQGMGSLPQLQFPQDLGKYQFVIIESDFVTGAGGVVANNIKFKNVYKLPIPVPLNEHYTTNFDENYNLLTQLANLLPGEGNNLAQAAGGLINTFMSAGLGLSVNTFRTVTLKNPAYRTHDLNWKLSPKNFQESLAIRSIAFGLKSGMAPSLQAGRTVFGFPSVFIMFFVPNLQFLYKFKPCVLQQIEIDYLGNNPSPAFYGNDASSKNDINFDINSATLEGMTALQTVEAQGITFNSSDNPPESVVIKTRWLELEYWVKEDFAGGEASTNPFDVFNWYNNKRLFG